MQRISYSFGRHLMRFRKSEGDHFPHTGTRMRYNSVTPARGQTEAKFANLREPETLAEWLFGLFPHMFRLYDLFFTEVLR